MSPSPPPREKHLVVVCDTQYKQDELQSQYDSLHPLRIYIIVFCMHPCDLPSSLPFSASIVTCSANRSKEATSLRREIGDFEQVTPTTIHTKTLGLRPTTLRTALKLPIHFRDQSDNCLPKDHHSSTQDVHTRRSKPSILRVH
jgi:hypothetical protein